MCEGGIFVGHYGTKNCLAPPIAATVGNHVFKHRELVLG